MTLVHSGQEAVVPTEQTDTSAVTVRTPGHLYFEDPTFDLKIALRGRKTVYGQPYVVAHVNRPGSARSGDDKAYARLFCAAPDMLEALKQARDFLRNAPLESGICCCGDPIAGHGFGSGHAPVDDIAYHSDQIAAVLTAAIDKATGASA